MKYQNNEQLELLCAEYVLGTLQGPARRRLEGLISGRGDIRRRIAEWDARLNDLAEDATPVTPSPAVWEAIAKRIDPATPRSNLKDAARLTDRVPFWRSVALASTFTTAVLAFLLVWPVSERAGDPGYVVMLRDRTESPVWIINTTARVDEMLIKATAQMDVPEGKRCFLWLQPPGSTQHHLLGVLPDSGGATMRIPAKLSGMMPGRLLVSIEEEDAPLAQAPDQIIDIHDEWLAPVTNQI